MNLFLDIETTGKPHKDAEWKLDFESYPYVVSIGWQLAERPPQYFLIHQEGRKMPKEVEVIHGITTKMSNDKTSTEPASFVFDALMCDAELAMNVIGHNLYFDVSIIKANVLRLYGPTSKQAKIIDQVLDKDKRIDTMRGAQKFMGGRWPKLVDLHKTLFGTEFAAHSALEDMLATKRCYTELRKRKIM